MLFQQSCSALVKQQWLFTVVGAGGNMHWYKESYSLLSIYGRATLVNKLLRHRYHAVTTLLSRLNNSVDNIVRKVQLNIVHGWQHNMLQDFALYISRRTPNLWFLSQHLSTQHTTFISQYSSTSERETYVVSCVGSVEIQIEIKKICFSITKGLRLPIGTVQRRFFYISTWKEKHRLFITMWNIRENVPRSLYVRS